MRERGLTVRDRIVVHLSGYSRFSEEYECPEDMCQSGISGAVDKSRAHVTLELNRMVREDMVSERTARVRGAKSKRKVYCLTAKGLARNAEMARHLESLSVNVTGPDCNGPMSGTEAVAYLVKGGTMKHAGAVERVIMSEGVLVVSGPDSVLSERKHLPPRQEDFVPRAELREILSILAGDMPDTLVVLGISGTGKTSLLNELAWRRDRDGRVFHMRLYPNDSALTVLRRLGNFFGDQGFSGLRGMGSGQGTADIGEAATLIGDCLGRGRFLLLFDEYDISNPALDSVFRMLKETVRGSGSGMVLASDSKPGFYSARDLALDKSVREVRLGGLDDEAALRLFRESGGTGKNISAAGGHPLMIKFLASGVGSETLMEYAENEILGKDSQLARACRFASVFRRPFSADDMELMGIAAASAVRGSLAFEAQPDRGYMLHPAVSGIMRAAMTDRMLANLHGTAAKFYIGGGTEPHEALYHLVRSGDRAGARSFLMIHGKRLLGSENPEELAGLIESFIEPDDESLGLLLTAARLCDQAGLDCALKYAGIVAEKAADSAEGTEARILIAKIQAKKGNFDEALKTLKWPAPAEPLLAGQWHYAHATVLRRMGRMKPALDKCEKAEAGATEAGDAALRAECGMESAMILYGLGDHERALGRLSIAMSEFAGGGNDLDSVRCGINTGIVLRAMDRIAEASDALETAVAKAERMGRNRLRAQGLANLTEVLNLQGEYRRAAELAAQAIRIFSGLGEPVMLAVCKFNLGTALARMGRNEAAVSEFVEAAGLLKKYGMLKSRRQWMLDAADLLDGMGEKKKAEKFRKDAG